MPIQLSGSLVITGSITTTGVITMSGSIASASYSSTSDLLQGTGSVGFTTTASFNAVSSSQQQISASYIALSASYNTFSGSASTRITENSSSIQQVSSSQQQISASLLNVISIFATTGSNSFRATQSITGSLTVTGQIIAQTLNVQQVTSSIIYSSGSNNFGCDLNSRQTFTGSVLITGSLTIAGGSSATSYSGTTIFGSTIACSPIGCFATSCATAFIGGTMSGTTIYGSTAVCSPVGKFSTCLDLGGALTGTSATFSSCVTANATSTFSNGSNLSAIFSNGGGASNFNAIELRGGTVGSTVNWQISKDNTVNNAFQITPSTTSGGTTYTTPGFTLASTGAATFACSVTSVGLLLNTGNYLGSRSLRAASDLLIFYGGTAGFNFTDSTNSTVLALINNSGVACFASTITGTTIYGSTAVCSPVGYFSGCVGIGTSNPNTLFHICQVGQPATPLGLYSSMTLQTDSQANYQRIRFDRDGCAFWGLGVEGNGSSNDFILSGLIGGKTSGTWSDNVFRIKNSNGNVGIGTSTPCQTLEVNGSILASSTGKIGFRYSSTNGNYYSYLRSATASGVGPIVLAGGFESDGGSNEAIRLSTNNSAGGERTVLSINNAGTSTFSGGVTATGLSLSCSTGLQKIAASRLFTANTTTYYDTTIGQAGMLIINSSNDRAGVFVVSAPGAGNSAISEIGDPSSFYSTTCNNANTVNLFFSGGSGNLIMQNCSGTTRDFSLTHVGHP